MLGIKREDLDTKSVISRIDNMSGLVFVSLMELLQVQSELRGINMARKRSRKSTAAISLEPDPSIPTPPSLGIGLPLRVNHRSTFRIQSRKQTAARYSTLVFHNITQNHRNPCQHHHPCGGFGCFGVSMNPSEIPLISAKPSGGSELPAI